MVSRAPPRAGGGGAGPGGGRGAAGGGGPGGGGGGAGAAEESTAVAPATQPAESAEETALMPVAIEDSPVSVEPVFLDTQAGPIHGYLVTVDLSDPRVEVVVSGGAEGELDSSSGGEVGAEVVLTPADAFVKDTGCVLAVNANFFRWLKDGQGKKTLADIVGLSITDGVVVSGANEHEGRGDPAVVFDAQGQARVLDLSSQELQADGGVWDGVAGIGGSDKDATPGTLLVLDGVNLGDTARPGPNVRHPRTAAGVSRGGDVLILAVIDGRQPGHSIGITLVELAALMIDAGADDAVNLDGGGSTALLCWSGLIQADEDEENPAPLPDPDGDGWITNRPSDGRYRPVANHLGFRLRGFAPPVSPVAYTVTPATLTETPTHE